jgi:hypothetical protein
MATSSLVGGPPDVGSELKIGQYEIETERAISYHEWVSSRLSILSSSPGLRLLLNVQVSGRHSSHRQEAKRRPGRRHPRQNHHHPR